MHAVEQAEAVPGDKVAVFGCGPIGLLALATLVDRGVDDIVAIDVGPAACAGRASSARPSPRSTRPRSTCGRSSRRLHGTAPFMFGPTPATDVFIEASGAPTVITDVIRPGVAARLVIVAVHYEPIPVSFVIVLMKELTIRGSMEYPTRFADAIDLLRAATSRRSSPTVSPSTTSTARLQLLAARRTAARSS